MVAIVNHRDDYDSERAQAEAFIQQAQVITKCSCEKHRPLPGSNVTMACRHVVELDTTLPIGVVLMPKQYFLCADCFRRMESCRFNFKELQVHCFYCILDKVHELRAKDPGLFTDLMLRK